ncbi:MAG TPA: hypothetical protein DCQ26_19175 [Marinilabiliales bacterium]|nr:MAG: hypothetical protein A2W95_09955 [Bacteroidetes bacterium GWA2_40_14]OFZ23643.1 MAG: hypothetical protein A2437_06270 [Bacteroidetes bacterium RIFOXYC2_FULL_40_12]HAN00721.1 hypothetical protein [Marinilabiliales bacterium]HAZ01152.1 hypothetical protein [Marinilabiliales bacterium]HBY52875.1 hypothetical protein [Marinilabiliales bacterium]
MSLNQKDYNYSYVPTNLAEYPAIGHDRRYDNLKIKGVVGLFTDTRAIGADYRFLVEELGVAVNPFNGADLITRSQAFTLGEGLGLAAFPKTIFQLSKSAGFVDIIMRYNISNQGVNNAPSIHKH